MITVFSFEFEWDITLGHTFYVDLYGGYVIAEKLRFEDENGELGDENDDNLS
jgi:hypothetical protein